MTIPVVVVAVSVDDYTIYVDGMSSARLCCLRLFSVCNSRLNTFMNV